MNNMHHVATKAELRGTLGSALSACERAVAELRKAQTETMQAGIPDVEYQLHEATKAISRTRLILYRRAKKRK